MGAFAGEQLVERDVAPQYAVENVGGDPSGGKAGDFRLGRCARARHTPIVAGKLCRGRELLPKNAATHSFGRDLLLDDHRCADVYKPIKLLDIAVVHADAAM
jgi:hypothetical protein